MERAVEEFLVPSVGILILVVLVKEFLGPVLAGLVYLGLTVFVLLGIYTAAKHWNLRYMPVFIVAGFALLWMAPSVISELLHPVVGVLGTLLGVGFLFGMVVLFLRKAGLDAVLDEL